MNDLIRFDPFVDVFPEAFRPWGRQLRNHEQQFDFKVDVRETDKEFKLKAEMPGLKKDDIDIAIDGNVVSISAETKHESEERNEKWLRSECYYGRVQRSFSLAQDIDAVNTTATYENGVLNLVMPKKQGVASKRIAVH